MQLENTTQKITFFHQESPKNTFKIQTKQRGHDDFKKVRKYFQLMEHKLNHHVKLRLQVVCRK